METGKKVENPLIGLLPQDNTVFKLDITSLVGRHTK